MSEQQEGPARDRGLWGSSSWPRWWNFKLPQWRQALWVGVILIAGLVVLASRPAAGGQHSLVAASLASPGAGAGASGAGGEDLGATQQAIDAHLAAVLSQVSGAGRVEVLVQLASGATTVFGTDVQTTESSTQETATGGSGQSTTQSTTSRQVVMGGGGGGPVVAGQTAPVVQGVLVVATGARSAQVASELARATQAVTGVPLYRIQVLPSNGGGQG